MIRALICGWPSLSGGEATAGDLLAMEAVAGVLDDAGVTVEVALNDAFAGGVDLDRVRPGAYECVVFACGPLHGDRIAAFARQFSDSHLVAVGVSVVDPDIAALFDTVIPRDGDDQSHPDLSFMRGTDDIPVIGVVRAHPQPEYTRSDHERVHQLIGAALSFRDCATVDFDTRVHPGADPFQAHARSSAAVGALAARMDAIVSTRLHGAVLSLARGVPVVAVDPVLGGAKVTSQMSAIGWPCSFTAGEVSIEQLVEAIEWCLTEDARARAASVTETAWTGLGPVCDALRSAVRAAPFHDGPD